METCKNLTKTCGDSIGTSKDLNKTYKQFLLCSTIATIVLDTNLVGGFTLNCPKLCWLATRIIISILANIFESTSPLVDSFTFIIPIANGISNFLKHGPLQKLGYSKLGFLKHKKHNGLSLLKNHERCLKLDA
jgi:hypothetical protein